MGTEQISALLLRSKVCQTSCCGQCLFIYGLRPGRVVRLIIWVDGMDHTRIYIKACQESGRRYVEFKTGHPRWHVHKSTELNKAHATGCFGTTRCPFLSWFDSFDPDIAQRWQIFTAYKRCAIFGRVRDSTKSSQRRRETLINIWFPCRYLHSPEGMGLH